MARVGLLRQRQTKVLLFHCKNGFVNAYQCYVVRLLAVLLKTDFVLGYGYLFTAAVPGVCVCVCVCIEQKKRHSAEVFCIIHVWRMVKKKVVSKTSFCKQG